MTIISITIVHDFNTRLQFNFMFILDKKKYTNHNNTKQHLSSCTTFISLFYFHTKVGMSVISFIQTPYTFYIEIITIARWSLHYISSMYVHTQTHLLSGEAYKKMGYLDSYIIREIFYKTHTYTHTITTKKY